MEARATSAPRAGWRPDETGMLLRAAQEAATDGRPLRGVFERIAAELGRMPGSVRNHYYAHIREGASGYSRRAAFRAFTDEEIDRLLQYVAEGRREGRSVRSCVMALADGDRTRMLRYQNKYRSLLKNAPERVSAAMQTEQGEDHQEKRRADPLLADPLTASILNDLRALLQRTQPAQDAQMQADRLRVRCDLMRLRLTEQGEAASELLQCVNTYLQKSEAERVRALPEFCARLPEMCGGLQRLIQTPAAD